ncbi:hypothetical protein EMCRGX_G029201 [Ephydatia muelleri]
MITAITDDRTGHCKFRLDCRTKKKAKGRSQADQLCQTRQYLTIIASMDRITQRRNSDRAKEMCRKRYNGDPSTRQPPPLS